MNPADQGSFHSVLFAWYSVSGKSTYSGCLPGSIHAINCRSFDSSMVVQPAVGFDPPPRQI